MIDLNTNMNGVDYLYDPYELSTIWHELSLCFGDESRASTQDDRMLDCMNTLWGALLINDPGILHLEFN